MGLISYSQTAVSYKNTSCVVDFSILITNFAAGYYNKQGYGRKRNKVTSKGMGKDH